MRNILRQKSKNLVVRLLIVIGLWWVYGCGCKGSIPKKCRSAQPDIVMDKYFNQIKEGRDWRCWSNGLWRSMGQWKRGQKHGRWITWHDNGKTHMLMEYYYGKLDGKVREWYATGVLKFEKEYNDGKLTKKPILWTQEGKRKSPAEDEAKLELKRLAEGAIRWYHNRSKSIKAPLFLMSFPFDPNKWGADGNGTYTNPPKAPCGKYPKKPVLWHKEPWYSLQFSFSRSHYLQYTYIVNNRDKKSSPSFTVLGKADVDCDGKQVIYKMMVVRKPDGRLYRSKIEVSGIEE